MTEKLFYADAHMRKFTARVLSCEERGGRFAVTLDRTAFFPEGGGQGGDTGARDRPFLRRSARPRHGSDGRA